MDSSVVARGPRTVSFRPHLRHKCRRNRRPRTPPSLASRSSCWFYRLHGRSTGLEQKAGGPASLSPKTKHALKPSERRCLGR